MIKRIAQTAGFAGLLAALLLTLLQILWVTPLILEAETYERASRSRPSPTNTPPASPPMSTTRRPGSRRTAGSVPSPPPAATWWWRSASP